jgi:hypothetical protein
MASHRNLRAVSMVGGSSRAARRLRLIRTDGGHWLRQFDREEQAQ